MMWAYVAMEAKAYYGGEHGFVNVNLGHSIIISLTQQWCADFSFELRQRM